MLRIFRNAGALLIIFDHATESPPHLFLEEAHDESRNLFLPLFSPSSIRHDEVPMTVDRFYKFRHTLTPVSPRDKHRNDPAVGPCPAGTIHRQLPLCFHGAWMVALVHDQDIAYFYEPCFQ